MKKVTNIALGKRIFAVEFDAYDDLSTYLRSIETRFANDADREEIINDIEIAIAEKLSAMGKSDASAITLEDVKVIVNEMGTAEEVVGDLDEQPRAETKETKRKLYRDDEDVIIAGVASGIAQYLGVDAVWVRLAFVLFIFSGVGSVIIPIYLLLWLLLPRANTTAERFSMRGSKVTLDELKSQVKEIVSKDSTHTFIKKIKDLLVSAFELLGTFINFAFKVLKLAAAGFLLVTGLLGAVGLISLYVIIWFADKQWINEGFRLPLEQTLGTGLGLALFVASFLLFFIPAVASGMLATMVLFKKKVFSTSKVVLLSSVWLVSLIVFITGSVLYIDKYAAEIKDYVNTQSYEFENYRDND